MAPKKPTAKPKLKLSGAGDPNYIKNMKKVSKPKPKETLPSLAQYKKSAAKNSMTYKEYLDEFKRRGIK